jgi:hypothetical protein
VVVADGSSISDAVQAMRGFVVDRGIQGSVLARPLRA